MKYMTRPWIVDAVQWDGTDEAAEKLIYLAAQFGYILVSVTTKNETGRQAVITFSNSYGSINSMVEGDWMVNTIIGHRPQVLTNLQFESLYQPAPPSPTDTQTSNQE